MARIVDDTGLIAIGVDRSVWFDACGGDGPGPLVGPVQQAWVRVDPTLWSADPSNRSGQYCQSQTRVSVSEPRVRRPRGRVSEPSPWSRSSFTFLPAPTVGGSTGRTRAPYMCTRYVHSAATRGSPHIAVPSPPHIPLPCAAHQSECGRTPLARGHHKEGPSP